MTVKCIHCGESIALGPDNIQARMKGTDPHQQLRKHLAQPSHAAFLVSHAHDLGWLIDALAFVVPADPEEWATQLHRLLDWSVEQKRQSAA